MKKTYITPKSESFSINLEGMIATSGDTAPTVGIDKEGSIGSESEILSNNGGWSSDNWTEK